MTAKPCAITGAWGLCRRYQAGVRYMPAAALRCSGALPSLSRVVDATAGYRMRHSVGAAITSSAISCVGLTVFRFALDSCPMSLQLWTGRAGLGAVNGIDATATGQRL